MPDPTIETREVEEQCLAGGRSQQEGPSLDRTPCIQALDLGEGDRSSKAPNE